MKYQCYKEKIIAETGHLAYISGDGIKVLWYLYKEPVAKEPVYWNDFALWDTTTRYSQSGQKSYASFFFVQVRKIISVQEIYSDSLFGYPCTMADLHFVWCPKAVYSLPWVSNSKLSLLLSLYIFIHYLYIFVIFVSFLQISICKKEMLCMHV